MSKKIDRSGVIPYIIEDGEIKMMFMRPSNPKFGGPEFQVAKGKCEDGENALEAGLREAGEELGLFTGNISEAHDLGTFLGRTTIHVVKIKEKEMFGDPHFETESTAWLTPFMFDLEGRDLHKPLVKAAVRLISEIENKRSVNEIQQIDSMPTPDTTNFTSGEEVAKSEHPFIVWKCESNKNPQMILYSLVNASGVKVSNVLGHFDHNNIFVIGNAWTDPHFQRKGYITTLYKTLYLGMNIKLASDIEQTPAMKEVWKKLPLPVKVFDKETKQIYDRKEITDDQLYSKQEPGRFRLFLENDWQPGDMGIPGVASVVIFEHVNFTNPDRPIKVI